MHKVLTAVSLLLAVSGLTAPSLKENPDYSLKAPFKQSALRERWTWSGNGFAIKKNAVVLTPPKPGTMGYLYHRYHFFHDDFIELHIAVEFSAAPAGASGVNVFVVQLAPLQTVYDGYDNPDWMLFTGLTLLVLGPTAEGKYFATHREFPQEARLTQAYIDLLADRRESVEGCELPDIAAVESLRLQIDFENANRMELLVQDRGRLFSCFVIERQMQYITARAFYLTLKARSAGGLGVALRAVSVLEKVHSFDVEEQMLVSQNLVEEIFDKVATFTQRLGDDKAQLENLAALQGGVLREAQRLEAYAGDLFHGTKRFQEFVLETLSEHKFVAPENLPKMETIRAKITALTRKQQDFTDLFTALRAVVATKDLLKKTQLHLQDVQAQIADLRTLVASPQFKALVERSQRLMDPLKSLSFNSMINTVLNARPDKARANRVAGLNLGLGAGTAAVLVFFALLILRKISSFESSQLR